MTQDINPLIDIAFKKIFGVKENEDLLLSLINSIVEPADQVSELTLLNPYNYQDFRNDKGSILDIKAVSKTGERYNIEVQISDEGNYDKRALYYWGKLYTEQLKSKGEYGMLSKAIGIHILHFNAIPETKDYHNIFHITEKREGFKFFKDLELHTIELKKFSNNMNESLEELLKKVKTSLDRWSAFLTHHDLLKANDLPMSLSNPELAKALHVLEVMSFKPDERELYEEHLKWLRMEASVLKKQREEGREEGIEIRNIQIAQGMLAKNYPIEDIIQLTQLSKEEVNRLK